MTRLKQAYPHHCFHPVHRLDKLTSGLLLVALDSDTNRALSHMFQQQLIAKNYVAITRFGQGKSPKKKQGTIKGDMAQARDGSYKLLQTKVNPAHTDFVSVALQDRRRFVLLTPKTGKTHQLRVAMKSISMPILGDERYGGEAADRLYLHAFRLVFTLNGVEFIYQCRPKTGDYFLAKSMECYWDKLVLDRGTI